MAKSLTKYAPRYLPEGYQLAREITGSPALGFGATESQLALFYTRGNAFEAVNSPLVVHVSNGPTSELGGTERREGVAVDLGRTDLVAVYHDGAWAPGPGNDQIDDHGIVFHWDTSTVHSITVRVGNVTVGVRGSRAQNIDTAQLVRVSRSLALAS